MIRLVSWSLILSPFVCRVENQSLSFIKNKMASANPNNDSLFLSRRVPAVSSPTLMEQLAPIMALRSQLQTKNRPFADLALNNPHDPPVPPSALFPLQHGFTGEIQAILEALQRRRGRSYRSLTRHHIWVTNGALGGLIMAMKCFCNVGDAIATVVPDSGGYRAMIEGLECSIVSVPLSPEHDFDLDVPTIVRTLHDNPKARILLLSSPNNPSGRISTPEKLQELARALQHTNHRRARHHLPPIVLLSDESYHRVIFPSTRRPFVSPASSYEFTISVYSYAKPFLAPSECLGWLALSPLWPTEKLGMTQRALDAVQVSTGWLFPSTAHAQCIQALKDQEEDERGDSPRCMNLHELEERRDELVATLSSHGVHLVFPNVVIPQSGFFVMVRVPEAFQPNHDVAFVRMLAERYRILAMPVSILGLPGWIRFSITASPEMIQHTSAGIHAFVLDYESNDPALAQWLPEKEGKLAQS